MKYFEDTYTRTHTRDTQSQKLKKKKKKENTHKVDTFTREDMYMLELALRELSALVRSTCLDCSFLAFL